MLIVGRAEIEAAIDLRAMGSEIERAFISASAGEIALPPVGHITFPAVDGDCHIKFGHRRGDDDFVIKVATGFPQQASIGEPTGNGLSLVLSAESGQVRAVLHDEMLLTDVRTGLGGAIASRVLARSDASRLLIVGTGIQARRQIEAHVALNDRPLIVQVWGRSRDAANRVAKDVAATCDASVVDDLAAACARAEVIVTTTAAVTPIIDADWIQPGAHITAVGADAPGKHELDPRLLVRADVLAADNRSQCLDHGELSAIGALGEPIGSIANVVEIGELLAGATGRQSATDITIADLTGIAAQDIAAANYILEELHPRSGR